MTRRGTEAAEIRLLIFPCTLTVMLCSFSFCSLFLYMIQSCFVNAVPISPSLFFLSSMHSTWIGTSQCLYRDLQEPKCPHSPSLVLSRLLTEGNLFDHCIKGVSLMKIFLTRGPEVVLPAISFPINVVMC